MFVELCLGQFRGNVCSVSRSTIISKTQSKQTPSANALRRTRTTNFHGTFLPIPKIASRAIVHKIRNNFLSYEYTIVRILVKSVGSYKKVQIVLFSPENSHFDFRPRIKEFHYCIQVHVRDQTEQPCKVIGYRETHKRSIIFFKYTVTFVDELSIIIAI